MKRVVVGEGGAAGFSMFALRPGRHGLERLTM